MNRMSKERWITWAAVPVLAAVLVALAVMQYRWSGLVSVATRAQMQASLQNSLMGFRLDFTRELAALCMEVRAALDDADADAAAGNPAQLSLPINGQIAHWQRTALHPALLEHVYLWKSGGDGPLLRLDPAGVSAQSVPWPAELANLHEHIQSLPSGFAMPGPGPGPRADGMRPHRYRRGRQGMHQGDTFLPWMVDPSNLILVSPVHRVQPDAGGKNTFAQTLIILQLNRNVLEKEIFADLAQKYFHGQPGHEYEVAVVESSKARQRIAYSSAAGFGENNGRPVDAGMPLFGSPFRRGGPPGADPGFLGPPGQAPQGRPPDRLMRFETLRDLDDPPVYEVLVKHERGSLEAAVSDLRRRSLMVSFGVLLLLAATMALIVVGAQRARRLARMQMEFVAGVSHELRTPLAVISSAAENIADGVIEDRQRVAQYGRSILKQSRQLTQLVEQVLLYAASDKTRRRLDLRPVDVVAAVESALESTSAVVKNAGFTVDGRFDSDLPAAQADFSALVQCLQNLITNAVKYGGENRWLGIRATATQPAGSAREILLTVEDRGMGVSREEMRQIFEPFYRGASAIDAQIHGTGLGLTLARTLAEAMGGKLTAESEPGRGSAFTLHLPVAQGRQKAAAPASLRKATTASDLPS